MVLEWWCWDRDLQVMVSQVSCCSPRALMASAPENHQIRWAAEDIMEEVEMVKRRDDSSSRW